jgi:hypothetical protein
MILVTTIEIITGKRRQENETCRIFYTYYFERGCIIGVRPGNPSAGGLHD